MVTVAVPDTDDNSDARRAARIRALKEGRGWTWSRIAEAMGVKLETVQTWGSPTKAVKPNWPHLAKLAELFDTTPGWIETGDDTAPPADPAMTLRYDVDQLRGQVAHNAEAIRFIAENGERISRLEEALAAGRRELAEVREILEQQAVELMPVVTRLLQVEADRRSSEAHLPEAEERRASTGRRRSDLPPR
jgi:transcriptional regulator with XRE-family HTH domain